MNAIFCYEIEPRFVSLYSLYDCESEIKIVSTNRNSLTDVSKNRAFRFVVCLIDGQTKF